MGFLEIVRNSQIVRVIIEPEVLYAAVETFRGNFNVPLQGLRYCRQAGNCPANLQGAVDVQEAVVSNWLAQLLAIAFATVVDPYRYLRLQLYVDAVARTVR